MRAINLLDEFGATRRGHLRRMRTCWRIDGRLKGIRYALSGSRNPRRSWMMRNEGVFAETMVLSRSRRHPSAGSRKPDALANAGTGCAGTMHQHLWSARLGCCGGAFMVPVIRDPR